jgi:hypothetical protein
MKLLLTSRGTRALKRALARDRRASVRIDMRAADPTGNLSPRVTRTVRVIR